MKDCFPSIEEHKDFLSSLEDADTCERIEELKRKLGDCSKVSRVLIFINSQDGARTLCSYLAKMPLIEELGFNPQVVIGKLFCTS